MSLIDILQSPRRKESLIHGVVTGIVTNTKDPDKMGRVKVKIPTLSPDDESAWARVASFMAGKERGAFFLPEVDDEVLLAFEYGDLSRPYILGALWNGKDSPPETNSDGKNNVRIIKSRSGHVIKLTDEDGKEKIEIIDKSKNNKITIDTAKNTVLIEAKEEIKIITKDGKLSIEAKEGKFKFSDKLSIEAKELEIKTDAAAKVESGADLDIKASGNLNAKGSMINLN
jgi:uncharacterized protein involved in type VI secretion and phage assembly